MKGSGPRMRFDPAATAMSISPLRRERTAWCRATSDDEQAVLEVYYTATTPRMLRVAVNGFFESLGVIVQVMEELDVDVLHEKGIEGLEGVQGVEQGMTGTAVGNGG